MTEIKSFLLHIQSRVGEQAFAVVWGEVEKYENELRSLNQKIVQLRKEIEGLKARLV